MGVFKGHPKGPFMAVEEISPAARFARVRALARGMTAADEAFHQSSHEGTQRDWREEFEDAADGLMVLMDLMEVRGLLAEIETFLTTKYGG